jgi:hypothetical protein
MENKAYLLKATGERVDLDHRPTLSEAQKLVGGYVELQRLSGNKVMYMDEEGKMKGKPKNKEATIMLELRVNHSALVVGDVLILEGWQTFAKE